ncbi:MAG: metallophosphoesterase [Proteobacteria bacterium]|nr:metallophosphoesterase [Pseudomonadota bacterium]
MKKYVVCFSIAAALLAFGCNDDAGESRHDNQECKCDDGTACPDGNKENCGSMQECLCDDGTACPSGSKENCGTQECLCDDGTECPGGSKENCGDTQDCLCDDGTECSEGSKDNCGTFHCEEGDESCQECKEGDECEPPKDECEDTSCHVGTLDCSGTKVIVCEATADGCGVWKDKEDCGIGKHCDIETHACVSGCLETCEIANEKRCLNNNVMECTSDSAGCAVWNMVAACGEDEICNDGTLSCSLCQKSCDETPIKCTDKGVATCSIGDDGCAVWTETACDTGKKCDPDSHVCTETCKDACTKDDTKCDSKGTYTCGNFDDDACLEWSKPTACDSNKKCDSAGKACVCKENCKSGDVRCNGTSVETCKVVDGCPVWQSKACDEGLVCLESTKQCGSACGNNCAPFSIVFLPDTQNYSRPLALDKKTGKITSQSLTSNRYIDQTNWIRDNKDKYNIRFVMHLGDITNFNLDEEWKVADAAHAVLDEANIPYLVANGNHDYRSYKYDATNKKFVDYHDGVYSRSRTGFTKYFTDKRFEGKTWFHGYHYGTNSYATFNVGDLKFLMISLEFAARKDVVCWADDLIKKYKDHYVILTTHNYLSRDITEDGNPNVKKYSGGPYLPFAANGVGGEALANELVKRHNNIILVASGHVSGAEFHSNTGNTGNTFYEMLVDYQSEKKKSNDGKKSESCEHSLDAGNGWLRMITIDPKKIKDNAQGRTFSSLGKAKFYDDTKEFYCSEYSKDSNYYSKSPTDSNLASFDKFQNNHNFKFSLDLTRPLTGEYKIKNYSFAAREINGTIKGEQTEPAVAINPSIGSFVAVWKDNSSDEDGKDSKGNPNYDIVGRLFYSGGCANGKQFTINTTTEGNQLSPDVAMDNNGNFVVVWTDDHDGNGVGQIYMRGFDDAGNERFKVATVNTESKGHQDNPEIAMAPDGRFVVVWEDESETSGKPQIFVRGFKADGKESFAQFNVSGAPKGTRKSPDVAMASDGSFVVTWADDGDDNGSYQVVAKAFNADGTAKGGAFTVNTVSTRQQLNPSIGMNAKGTYFIAYEDNSVDKKLYAINVRGFNKDNKQIFADQPVHAASTTQSSPTICVNGDGNAVVGWFGTGERKKDGDKYDSPELQRKTIKLKEGNYVISSVGNVTAIGYTKDDTNAIDKMPDVACANSGRHVFVWSERLDKGKASEIYGRGYNGI